MKSYGDTLNVAGNFLIDDDLALYILGGLCLEYEFVIVNITSRSNSISIQVLQFLLQNHEMHLQQHTTATLTNVQANLTNLNINGLHKPSFS